MAKKPKHQEVEENEFAAEAEKTGDMSHDEAMAASVPESKADGDVKKPELQGHKKEDFGKPKYGSSVNSKTEDIGKPKPETEE